MGHDRGEGHHELTREELFKPYKPTVVLAYIYPFFGALFDVPVTIFREQVVEKIQKKYPYYHRRYRRVPTIETCATDDLICIEEANQQFCRDRLVDMEVLRILRRRRERCAMWYQHDKEDVQRFCRKIFDEHEEAAVNYFVKYGELSWNTDARDALMKQKHRMLWERRHGPVGSGQMTPMGREAMIMSADKATEENMITKLRSAVGLRGLPKEMAP